MKKSRIAGVIAVLALAGLQGCHQPAATTAAPPTPAALGDEAIKAFAKTKGLEVQQTFVVEGGRKVVAYVQADKSGGGVFYANPDGTFIAGQIFGKDGQSLTEAHFKRAWPDGAPTAETLADLDAAFKLVKPEGVTTVSYNKGGPELWMIYEPHCGYCQQAQKGLETLDVTVHYLPVSFLRDDSDALVAAMLSGPDAATQVLHHQDLGALSAQFADKVASTRPLIENNAQVMRLAGVTGTPAFFWRDADGKLKAHRGFLDANGLRETLGKVGIATSAPQPAVAPAAG